MWPNDSTLIPVSAVRAAPGAGARRPSEPPQPWQHDPPPSYAEVMGRSPPALPARSFLHTLPVQISNLHTKTLLKPASIRALARRQPGAPLPKAVEKELQSHLQRRLRTQVKLTDALDSQMLLEAGISSNAPLQTIAASGGLLFDDDEVGVEQLEMAQVRVHHYEAKQDRLLNEHQVRMAQIRVLAAD